MVTVGRIVRPHGNRGQVVVESETDFGAARFAPGAELFASKDGEVVPYRVAASRPYDARWVVGFEGVGSMDAAEALRGLELRVPAGALHPLGDGEYYVHDLVGCRVVTDAGDEVGVVGSVMFGGSAPLLSVGTGVEDDEVLVPLAADICIGVDVDAKRIVIAPPDGLLELNRRRRDR